ncbi:MAG: TldD/PmbA family protein [Candidatus Eisenbacteria bacterium]
MDLEARFREVLPDVEFCSLRLENEAQEFLYVRDDIVLPVRSSSDVGAMITVVDGGGVGYAATADLTSGGLAKAVDRARTWAASSRGRTVTDFSKIVMPHPKGNYTTPVRTPWASVPLSDKISLLREECARVGGDPRIVQRDVSISYVHRETLYLTNDGGRVEQSFDHIVPSIAVTAHADGQTLSRSLGGRGYCRQGGYEVVSECGLDTIGPELRDEVLELLSAPDCPTGNMDVVLDPDQVILQVHESIGHPLELDRILGDERNYAGRSFVTPDMFGSYRYGSDLLNITYDPTRTEEFASYGFDDEGLTATREFLIRNGILERALGGHISQQRAGVPGVACSRANGWTRPPIDRMANVNLEPGDATLGEMIARVEDGVYMKTNTSWSIDDSRNKFQFGCEWGRRIENGKLTHLVRKPNYRGISATFWRSLAAVGNESTFMVLGTPNCGKGEPSQTARAGHAAPTCLFTNVDVFGGE